MSLTIGLVHVLQITQTPGLTYGFIPGRVMAMLIDKSNWKARSEGVEELLGLVVKMDNPQAAAKHTASIVDLIMTLIDDSNLQISLRALEVWACSAV